MLNPGWPDQVLRGATEYAANAWSSFMNGLVMRQAGSELLGLVASKPEGVTSADVAELAKKYRLSPTQLSELVAHLKDSQALDVALAQRDAYKAQQKLFEEELQQKQQLFPSHKEEAEAKAASSKAKARTDTITAQIAEKYGLPEAELRFELLKHGKEEAEAKATSSKAKARMDTITAQIAEKYGLPEAELRFGLLKHGVAASGSPRATAPKEGKDLDNEIFLKVAQQLFSDPYVTTEEALDRLSALERVLRPRQGGQAGGPKKQSELPDAYLVDLDTIKLVDDVLTLIRKGKKGDEIEAYLRRNAKTMDQVETVREIVLSRVKGESRWPVIPH